MPNAAAASLAVLFMLLPLAASFSGPAPIALSKMSRAASKGPVKGRMEGSRPLESIRMQTGTSEERQENGCDKGMALPAKGVENPELASLSASQMSLRCDSMRRKFLAGIFAAGVMALPSQTTHAQEGRAKGGLVAVSDPDTYSALSYQPPGATGKLPLIVVLHGAGINEEDVWNLANPKGEHVGLIPSLLAAGKAPNELTENFAVLAPYSYKKRSFYEEPRGRLLQFIEWAKSDAGRLAGCPDIDPNRIFLFGFSDGSTVGVELMTTGRFAGGVFAAYGFTGDLPALALKRLKDIPIWIFHSADDVIFPVSCSDKLVKALRKVGSKGVVKYTRLDKDQEGFTGSVRGHSTGITASKDPEERAPGVRLPRSNGELP